eukprot:9676-Heterococcus_DN1.PRE.2
MLTYDNTYAHIVWADQKKKALREVREFKIEDMSIQLCLIIISASAAAAAAASVATEFKWLVSAVGSTATKEQLHHQQPKHWREMVKSERAKEGEHLHKTEDIKLEGDDDTVSHGTRSKSRGNGSKADTTADTSSISNEISTKPVCVATVPFGRPGPYPNGFCSEPDLPVTVESHELQRQTLRCRGMMTCLHRQVADAMQTPITLVLYTSLHQQETLYLIESEIPDTPGEIEDMLSDSAPVADTATPVIPYFSEDELAEQQAVAEAEARATAKALQQQQARYEASLNGAAAAAVPYDQQQYQQQQQQQLYGVPVSSGMQPYGAPHLMPQQQQQQQQQQADFFQQQLLQQQ